MKLLPVSRLLLGLLVCCASIGCGAVGCRGDGARAERGGSGGQAAAPRPSPPQGATPREVPVSASDSGPVLNVKVELDAPRGARRVLSSEGGSLTAIGADGSTYKLTIPEDALAGEEEIIVTPVTAVSGLPADVTLAAGVQLAPDGLLLLKPAALTIESRRPAAPEQELPIGWSRTGEGVHAEFVALEPKVPTFTVTHFSGVAVTSAGGAGAATIARSQALPCAGQYFAEVAELIRRARQAALAGQPSTGGSIAEAFIEASRRYVNEALKPVLEQAEKDDLLLPCAASALFSWERNAQLMLGDSFEQEFGTMVKPLHDSLWRGVASSFNASYERCMRDESPLFQLSRMIGAVRQLEMMGRSELTPPEHMQKIQSCGRRFDYRVDVEMEMDNVYNEQGQGIDVTSSKTTLTANGILTRYDEQRSARDAPVFTAKPVDAQANVSFVPRHPCPDQVRVQPGSKMGITVKPIMNPRVGQLRCENGRAKCDATDVNPGVLVELAPQVVENTYLHTYTGDRCSPAGDWNEFMMFSQGAMSVGDDIAIRVPGASGSVNVVRYGGSVRRVPMNIPQQILAMNPGMKDYVDIQTPAIKQATQTARVKIEVSRR